MAKFKAEIIGEDRLSPAARTARASTDDLSKSTKGLTTSLGGVTSAFKMISPYLAGTAILAGMKKMITATAEAGDQYSKMSQKIGVSVETLSAFDHVAKLSGISLDTVAVGLRRFAQNALDMSRGIGEAKREFEDLGISVLDGNGKLRNMEDLVLEVADKFSQMEDNTTKTAMAMRLFGRSGTEMIPMLNAGKDGLTEMMQKARDLGLVMSEEDARAAVEFRDSLTDLQGAVTGLGREITITLLPSLTGWIQKSTELTIMLREHREEIRLGYEAWKMILDPGRIATQLYDEFGKKLPIVRGKISDLILATEAKNKADRVGNETLAEKLRLEKELAATEEYWAGIRMKAALEEAKATDEFIGLTGMKEAAYELFIKGEQKAVEDLRGSYKGLSLDMGRRIHMLTEIYNTGVLGAKKLATETENVSRTGDGLARVFSYGVAGAIDQAIFSGKDLGDVMKDVFRNMVSYALQYITQLLVVKTLQSYIGVGGGGGGGGGGFNWGSLLSSIASIIVTILAFLHEGGTIGQLQRAHRGILVGSRGLRLRQDEVPIIAQTGEGVLSRKGMKAAGGPEGLAALNKGESSRDISVVQNLNLGGVYTKIDMDEVMVEMGRSIMSTMREYT